MNGDPLKPQPIVAPEAPVQFNTKQIFDPEVDTLIRISQAQESFQVSGEGLTVAVLDTGLRTTHRDFAGRLRAQRNFTSDNSGDPNNVFDGRGHGTHVTGIIAANGVHRGIAPKAGIAALKVLRDDGGHDDADGFGPINQALQWVLDNRAAFNITAVSLSIGEESNATDDTAFEGNETLRLIRELRSLNIPLITSAGNRYARFSHRDVSNTARQGMCFPAILRETISVGAVYDAAEGDFFYPATEARAFSTMPDQITPYSQRRHEDAGTNTFTTIFAPGSRIASSGNRSDTGESVQEGTSQAAPVTAGVVLLMQELYQRTTGNLPSVDTLAQCLRNGAAIINDGDNENDNVRHTGKDFRRIHALRALDAIRRNLLKELLTTKKAFC